MNNEWYMVIDVSQKTAIDYIQLTDEWKGISGMHNLTDYQLATINEWSNEKRFILVSKEESRSLDVNTDSIDIIFDLCFPEYVAWIRKLRDRLLECTDAYATADRWQTFDAVSKRNITNYRNALRDVTENLAYGEKWPSLPKELKALCSLKFEDSLRPSKALLNTLKEINMTQTKSEIQADQWLRIQAERDRRRLGGIKALVDDKEHWFWTDETARGQYSLMVNSIERNNLDVNAPIAMWRTMSGELIPLSAANLHDIIDRGIANEQMVFSIAENHRRLMLAMDEPEKYDYTTDWPEIYDGAVSPASRNPEPI